MHCHLAEKVLRVKTKPFLDCLVVVLLCATPPISALPKFVGDIKHVFKVFNDSGIGALLYLFWSGGH